VTSKDCDIGRGWRGGHGGIHHTCVNALIDIIAGGDADTDAGIYTDTFQIDSFWIEWCLEIADSTCGGAWTAALDYIGQYKKCAHHRSVHVDMLLHLTLDAPGLFKICGGGGCTLHTAVHGQCKDIGDLVQEEFAAVLASRIGNLGIEVLITPRIHTWIVGTALTCGADGVVHTPIVIDTYLGPDTVLDDPWKDVLHGSTTTLRRFGIIRGIPWIIRQEVGPAQIRWRGVIPGHDIRISDTRGDGIGPTATARVLKILIGGWIIFIARHEDGIEPVKTKTGRYRHRPCQFAHALFF